MYADDIASVLLILGIKQQKELEIAVYTAVNILPW